MRVLYKSIRSSSLKCAKCQIFGTFGTPNTKMKLYQMFQISKIMPHCYSTVSNIMRQYGQQWQNGILLFFVFFSLLFHRYLSLRRLSLISSLSVTLYLFPLLSAQESCSRSLSRKLLPISPPHFPVLTSPRCWSRHLILHNSPPHALVLVDLVGFGFVIGFWFGLRLWVVSQVTSMGWVEVVGCGFDGLIQVI